MRFILHRGCATELIIFVVIAGLICFGIGTEVYTRQQYRSQVDKLRSTIDALEAYGPHDVPAPQWTKAVEWTSNIVVQDFNAPPQEEKFQGLLNLNKQLGVKKNEPIDLAKLRWIWDEIEAACGGPNSVASRLRDVKLMTKGPITDDRLPSLWALKRCTALDLSGTEITDVSVPFLRSLPNLERLNISQTKITANGAKEIQDSRVALRVFHESLP